MSFQVSKELSAQEYSDLLEELGRHGMEYKETKGEDIYFKCSKHPYQEETIPQLRRQEIFNKLGNLHFYNALNKTLTIKSINFMVDKK